MRQVIFHAVGGEFTLDRLVRAAHAGALGVAALDHEAVDDAVEGQAVIEALFCQLQEVINRDGGGVAVQLHGDGAVILHLDLHMVLSGRAGRVVVLAAGSKDADGQRRRKDQRKPTFHDKFLQFLYHLFRMLSGRGMSRPAVRLQFVQAAEK